MARARRGGVRAQDHAAAMAAAPQACCRGGLDALRRTRVRLSVPGPGMRFSCMILHALCLFRPAAASQLATAKKGLLTSIAKLRREATVQNRNAVLSAVEALEACSGTMGAVDGRWSLIFSTQGAPPKQQPLQGNAFQPLIDATYSAFFKVAPALAGAAQDGSSGSAANEQTIDYASGRVRNRVRIALPFSGRLDIRVNGDVSRVSDRDLAVTFSDCSFQLDGIDASVQVPLPRPVGSLETTWCDEDLRISRGGRGGIFILRRLRDETAQIVDTS